MLSQISFSLFAQSAQQQSECPPAGASQEVNEAAPSLAAPSASGQQAGTPSYIGPFLPRRGSNIRHMQGGWDSDWWADWQVHGSSLDAPDLFPSGGHVAYLSGSQVYADGYAGYRP
ncbi:hypothetical protein [Variovorax sp. 160MFSha2.1]|uniref:hypothetical protein n=1 Tax=Variovorax sp. 160MFSha2.1 TaxID=3158367 RepID=UPI003AAA2499